MGERVNQGTLLWRDPTVQLGRFYRQGLTFDALERLGLHSATRRCFTQTRGDRAAETVHLYKHQSDAICAILGLHTSQSPIPNISLDVDTPHDPGAGLPALSTRKALR